MNYKLEPLFGDFIREHRNDDVRKLALQIAGRKDIDVPFVLEQIAGWQKACEKLPSWAAFTCPIRKRWPMCTPSKKPIVATQGVGNIPSVRVMNFIGDDFI